MRKDLVEIYFPMYFNKFASLLDESKGSYVAGNSLTYADLALANFFNVVEELVDPNCLDNYPKLKALQEDVCNIPQVKAFLEEQKSTDKVQPIGG
jgi:glutathione S-transferase